ncbi:hypothetical protein B0O99DRAFT_592794 [Bisporella sp. PMI_857]|nr:hypothetical protein B0O99DRAFT_592794 [Bisporella sp. PMI_857]
MAPFKDQEEPMTQETFRKIDLVNLRADITIEKLDSKTTTEQVNRGGKDVARKMMQDIVELYNDKPNQASEAFDMALQAWSIAGHHAGSKIDSQIKFAKIRQLPTADLERKKELAAAYFGAAEALTKGTLADLAEEMYLSGQEDGDGGGAKVAKAEANIEGGAKVEEGKREGEKVKKA